MPELSNSAWNEVDASNNSTPPSGWPENQAASTVNDCARMMMGALKRFWNRINPALDSTGSANSYALTPTSALAAYVDGEIYSFQASFANTGAATLNISGLGATAIKKFAGGTKTALAANDIGSGQPVQVCYDGTDMVLLGYSTPSTAAIFGGTSGGAANVQTLTPGSAITAYTTGAPIIFKAGFTNSASATMNVSAVGAKTIKVKTATATAALAGGEIVANNTYELVYDGTDLILQNPSWRVWPKFHATIGADQVIPDNVATKVLFDTEQFDTNTNYVTGTTCRFTPTVAGTYNIAARLSWSVLPTVTIVIISIYKNGASVADWQYTSSGATFETRSISDLIAMNGSSDYVEIFVLANTTSGTTTLYGTGGLTYSAFTGELLP